MDPMTKALRSDFIWSASAMIAFIISITNCGKDDDGGSKDANKLSTVSSLTGAHRRRKAVNSSLSKDRVECRGDDVGGKGDDKETKIGWFGGKRDSIDSWRSKYKRPSLGS